MRKEGRPRLSFTDVAIEGKHEMEGVTSISPTARECQRHTYLEETNQTLLKPRTDLSRLNRLTGMIMIFLAVPTISKHSGSTNGAPYH